MAPLSIAPPSHEGICDSFKEPLICLGDLHSVLLSVSRNVSTQAQTEQVLLRVVRSSCRLDWQHVERTAAEPCQEGMCSVYTDAGHLIRIPNRRLGRDPCTFQSVGEQAAGRRLDAKQQEWRSDVTPSILVARALSKDASELTL